MDVLNTHKTWKRNVFSRFKAKIHSIGWKLWGICEINVVYIHTNLLCKEFFVASFRGSKKIQKKRNFENFGKNFENPWKVGYLKCHIACILDITIFHIINFKSKVIKTITICIVYPLHINHSLNLFLND